MLTKYQLYIKKSGTKRWLKKGIPHPYIIINRKFKKYGKDIIHDVKMKRI